MKSIKPFYLLCLALVLAGNPMNAAAQTDPTTDISLDADTPIVVAVHSLKLDDSGEAEKSHVRVFTRDEDGGATTPIAVAVLPAIIPADMKRYFGLPDLADSPSGEQTLVYELGQGIFRKAVKDSNGDEELKTLHLYVEISHESKADPAETRDTVVLLIKDAAGNYDPAFQTDYRFFSGLGEDDHPTKPDVKVRETEGFREEIDSSGPVSISTITFGPMKIWDSFTNHIDRRIELYDRARRGAQQDVLNFSLGDNASQYFQGYPGTRLSLERIDEVTGGLRAKFPYGNGDVMFVFQGNEKPLPNTDRRFVVKEVTDNTATLELLPK